MTTTAAPLVDTINILVADKLAPAGVEYLRAAENVHVDVKMGLDENELAAIVGDYDGLLVRSAVQVTARVLEHPGRLKAIARAGVGVDNIDLDAATNAGVLVMNSAEASTITTAEHAFALMMALARNVGPAARTMYEGNWDRNKFVGTELWGKTLGIVGFGRIGQTVAERALAFGMTVLAYDPVFHAETALEGKVKLVSSFGDLVEQVDFLSFHVPLNDHTRGMLNTETFARARPGLRVINAARGGVVDIDDLIKALDAGQCAGAAIDVYEKEPPAEDDPLRRHPRILVTPHLGASTSEAQEGVSTSACAQILEYLQGRGLRGAVNAAGVSFDLNALQMRFVDLARRMARLVAPLCEAGIAEVTVTCQGETLPPAATTIERVVLVELLNSLLDQPVNVVNASVIGQQRGIRTRAVVEDEPRTSARVGVEIATGSGTHTVRGCIYADGRPRILEIDGYHMDMVPAGPMILLHNEDRPGMVGLVGSECGTAGANIADLALSRSGDRALMVLKLDAAPDDALVNRLRARPGILQVAAVHLPELAAETS